MRFSRQTMTFFEETTSKETGMLHQIGTIQRHSIVVSTRRATMAKIRSLVQKAFGVGLAAALVYAALIGIPSPSLAAGGQAPSSAAGGPVATKAICGKDDRPETGLQGQTDLADRFASNPPRAFNCNLELMGQAAGDGASFWFAITDECAYYGQYQAPELLPVLDNPGVVVVDVADSAHPKIVKYLQTPAMIDANHSLRVDLGRHLLIGQATDQVQRFGKTIDIYDISDCRNPILKFSGIIPGANGTLMPPVVLHSGNFTKDGTIFWTAPAEYTDTIYALDVSDPSKPKVIANWTPKDPRISRFHTISLSDDGNTAYLVAGRHYPKDEWNTPSQGILILDVSEVQARKPNPQIRMIGEPLYWTDVTHGQWLMPMTVKGHKYLWAIDVDGAVTPNFEVPTGRQFVGPLATRAYPGPPVRSEVPAQAEQECRQNPDKPAWGYVSIIDIENPVHPVRVSGVRLEVHEPKNCLAIAHDPSFDAAYSPGYCDVDDYQDAKMMVCTFNNSGVRVFDIRDVYHPREIAYYKPPAVGAAPRKASLHQTFRETGITWGESKYHTADPPISAYFARGGKEIWFTSEDNGFQILRFSDELMAREKDLFTRDITCDGKLRGPHGCPSRTLP